MSKRLQNRLLLSGISADLRLSANALALEDRTWLAMTSSHLGKSTGLHQEVCRYISRSMVDARQLGRVLLVATGSAIEPWATRAADLFGAPLILVQVSESLEPALNTSGPPRLIVRPLDSVGRDEIVVALADRVDCVFARPKGRIESSLLKRLRQRPESNTRVAVFESSVDKGAQHCARTLMGKGAVGWYCGSNEVVAAKQRDSADALGGAAKIAPDDWTRSKGDWVVHCTRACHGPWPGQSIQQHRDELLLGGMACSRASRRTPLESLCRIVQMHRLVASAITSRHAWRVVCFSDLPLATLLSRRNYRSHVHRWDYEPYGIAIRKTAAIEVGFQPVIYGPASRRKTLSETDQYRFQSIGKTYDWRQESEWRSRGDVDLDQFDPQDVRLFVPTELDAKRMTDRFPVTIVGNANRR